MINKEFIADLSSRGYGHRIENGHVVVDHPGYVYLNKLTSLPEGVTFENQDNVFLGSLTALPEGVTFQNQGSIDLDSLTVLPEGVTFQNQGYVDLSRLTSLPAGVTFQNQGYVYLSSLTDEKQVYMGKEVALRNVDGWTMLIVSERQQGDISVAKSRYFGGGEIAKLKACYIAAMGQFLSLIHI